MSNEQITKNSEQFINYHFTDKKKHSQSVSQSVSQSGHKLKT